MIEIRSFTGGPQELHEFVRSVWEGAYQGRMAFPIWTPEYLDWQLDLSPGSNRDFVLAAYDGERIAGVILGCPVDFQTQGGVRRGVLSSWLSVDPAYRGQGLVARLKAEQARKVSERGGDLVFAYRYVGSRYSLSKPPTVANLESGEWTTRKVGFWVRVLNSRRATGWFVDRLNRVATVLGAPFMLKPGVPQTTCSIRAYEARDLPGCLARITAENAQRMLSIAWSAESLGRHCSGPVGQCLVAEKDGEVRGFITWHVLPFHGRTVERVGIIDLVVIEGLSGREGRALVGAVLQQIAADGGVLALKLKTGDAPITTMLACGFIPWLRDSREALRAINGSSPVPLQGPQQVLWR